MARLPPGISCDQFYVYLQSGYDYSFKYGVMYHLTQLPSDDQMAKLLRPKHFNDNEVAYYLSNGYYYNFGQRAWVIALFSDPLLKARIWQQAAATHQTLLNLQNKSKEVRKHAAILHAMSMGVEPRTLCPSVPTSIRSMHGARKEPLRRVNGNKHKQQGSEMKEKVRSLPPKAALDKAYWDMVLK
jgi:hypothetical protein